MIRERVSTSGVLRELEPENELTACTMPLERIAQLSEETVGRYHRNKRKFDQQFEHTIKSIEKSRQRNLAKSKEDTIKRITVLQQSISRESGGSRIGEDRHDAERRSQSGLKFDQRVLSSPGWAWSWVLDESENPPPSSIVARRDTEEARQLAAVADWATREGEDRMSANNLWAVIQNFLTAAPGNQVQMKQRRKGEDSPNRTKVSVAGEDEVKNGKELDKVAHGTRRNSVFAKVSGFVSKS